MILAVALVFAVIAYLMVSQITPRYTARASVMLDPRSVQVLSSEDVVSDLQLSHPLLDTEVAVLRSNLLLEQVIQSFEPSRLEAFDPANRPVPTTTRIKMSIRSALGSVRDAILGGGNEAGGNRTSQLLGEEEMRMRRLIGALRQSLTVWREGQSYLISVSVETEDPELSTLFANGIVRTYLASQVSERVGAIEGATRFLAERVEEMRSDVEAAESAIEEFRTNQLARVGVSPATIEQQLQELSTQLALARADLAQAQARYDQIQSVIDADGFAAAAELLSSPFVLSLRQQLSEISRENADLATRLSPDHPERQTLRAEIEALNEELSQEVRQIVATMRNEVEVARIREQSIQDSLSAIENRAADLSRANVALRQLEREADAARENYLSMLNRLNETRSTEQVQRADARMVERAVIPGAPSAPRTALFTVFGGVLGFSVGLVISLILLMTGAGFKRAGQVEQTIGLPVLASLLKGNWRSPRAMLRQLRETPYQNFAERLRQLRTALMLRKTRSDGGQCVLLASSVAGEGKTSTTLALAYLEALSKRSCVVLDFDLRRSPLAREFGYEAKTDLAGVLLEGKPLEDAVYTVPEFGFDLITVKKSAPELVDVANSDALAKLVESLKAKYDLVLIDTAPILLVSDTLRLARLADYALLLVRQNATNRRAVAEAARMLEDLGATSISVALTMCDPRNEKATYGYESQYAYGSP
nr:polysaccharide biosynthesis tyrosine autokinase [Salipiger abyssi]